MREVDAVRWPHDEWFCHCPVFTVDSLGECVKCRRKPRELLKVAT